MKTISPSNLTQSAALNRLLHHHRQFQIYLDLVATSDIDKNIIDVLIPIRQFNVDCIGKYSDLIAQSNINIKPAPKGLFKKFMMSGQDNMILNDINKHLSWLLPAYRRALSNRAIHGFARMIIGNNSEKIVNIKDNLLHPLPERYYA